MDGYETKGPSEEDQHRARLAYDALSSSLKDLHTEFPEIEISETKEKIQVPISALRLLAKILNDTAQGYHVSIVPVSSDITTQAAAEYLGCSRPHVVKLLKEGEIPYHKIGKHRRIKYQDLASYKSAIKAAQKKGIEDLMQLDEDSGLYNE